MAQNPGPRLEELAGDAFTRQHVGTAIKWLAVAKDDYDKIPVPEFRAEAATRMLTWALRAVAYVVGPDALKLVYGAPEETDRHRALLIAWQRLTLVEPLFDELASSADLGSFSSLKEELLAIANDDTPRLFDRIEGGGSGVRRNTYRLAHHKLRALGWETYLRSHGYKAGQAQNIVSGGFGRTWEAIKNWRVPVEDALGADNVAMVLRMARDGSDFHYANALHRKEVVMAVRTDGEAFAAEERRNKANT